jgi:hypothetical protein
MKTLPYAERRTFVFCIWFSELTAIAFLNNINRLVFTAGKSRVSYRIRIGFFILFRKKSVFKELILLLCRNNSRETFEFMRHIAVSKSVVIATRKEDWVQTSFKSTFCETASV